MAGVSPTALSLSPAALSQHNDHSNPPFVKPFPPFRKQKVSNHQPSYFRGQYPGAVERSVEFYSARQLFANFPERDVVVWSNIIASNSRSGNFARAFCLFEKMMGKGLRPNGFALGSLLKASSGFGAIGLCRQVHSWSIRAGFGFDVGVRVALISSYSRCGTLDDAQQVFYETLVSSFDCVSLWNAIIAAYAFHGCWILAFQLFHEMLSVGLVEPSEFTYASMVSACGFAGEEKYGMMIHGRMIKCGVLQATNLWNSLITMYAKFGNLKIANQLFERILTKNVVSWNAIIAANEQNSEEENAINLFRSMLKIEPPMQLNRITFHSVLSAVSSLAALKLGREIHAHLIRLGLNIVTSLANSLINMYSKGRDLDKARVIFEMLPFKDVVTWNSILAGYEQNEQRESCFHIFKKMLLSGKEPDSHSYTIILSAASSDSSMLMNLRRGQEIHGHILRRTPSIGLNLFTSNAILFMYAKFNRMPDAETIFRTMKQRDSYSWNTMIDGYSSNGKFEEALLIFLDMLRRGFPLDHMSFSILLSSCGRLNHEQLGKQFHSLSLKQFYDHHSVLSINNSLVSMYSKCGSIDDASQVFLRMQIRDVFSWTAMITGYAYCGMTCKPLQLFERMKADGIMPNHVTFLGLLTACAHGGLIEEGICYFKSMIRDYGLNPSIEHYACLIDLFGRSGQLEPAKALAQSAISLLKPHHSDTVKLWRVLLGACHAHNQLELGVEAATKILELEPEDVATHILLSNLYASSGHRDDAIRVRRAMADKGLKKEIGCSWIDYGNRRHTFVAGDGSHPERKEIYEKLAELNCVVRKMGYVPMTEFVLHEGSHHWMSQ